MAKRRIAIIGLGLIGGSLGLALKQARSDEIEVVGFARRPETGAEALRRGAVDRIEVTMARTASEADVVIVATPIMTIRDVFTEIAPGLASGAVVSDVGSTKATVMEWAARHLPPNVSFVGGHPMTGKETSGLDEAEAGLFRDSIYCLAPAATAGDRAVELMKDLVVSVGARPLIIEPARHDQIVAGISHLPLLLSSALVSTVAGDELWPEMAKLAASGFRDTSRLASGSPELNHGICATNRQAIVDWIDRYIESLSEFRRLVLEDDRELQDALRAAQKARQDWLQNEGRRFNR